MLREGVLQRGGLYETNATLCFCLLFCFFITHLTVGSDDDVVVYGATASGVVAPSPAAREGSTVLVEPGQYVADGHRRP
jgi:hypothetical protein